MDVIVVLPDPAGQKTVQSQGVDEVLQVVVQAEKDAGMPLVLALLSQGEHLRGAISPGTRGFLQQKTSSGEIYTGMGKNLVEAAGIEPATFSVQTRCSPN